MYPHKDENRLFILIRDTWFSQDSELQTHDGLIEDDALLLIKLANSI